MLPGHIVVDVGASVGAVGKGVIEIVTTLLVKGKTQEPDITIRR